MAVTDAAGALELAHRGDRVARRRLHRAGDAIGRAIGTVANLFGPERVIISGEGLAAYDLFAEADPRRLRRGGLRQRPRSATSRPPLPFDEWARGAAATAIQSFIRSEARH